MENEDDSDTNRSWSPWNSPREYEKETEGTGNPRKNRDYPDYSSPGIE